MLETLSNSINYFKILISTPQQDNVSLVVDLQRDFNHYSFLRHHPKERHAIEQVFQKTVINQGQCVSAHELLQASTCRKEDLILLDKMGFSQLGDDPEVGMVLEHPALKGWLIKKNYGYKVVNQLSGRITKSVEGRDFPTWMLPPHLQKGSKHKTIGVQVPNDVINPLRVVVLEKGRQCIDDLKLDKVRAALEYLYVLPVTKNKTQAPWYESVVVISKKENIVSEKENIYRFIEMARKHPKELLKLATQIALFIKYTQLTDVHLGNIRFLSDHKDTIFFMDGEPIGGLSDASEPRMAKAMQAFDPGFFPLLGLKKLITSLREDMEFARIPESDIQKVQEIFNQAINPIQADIIRERRWIWINQSLNHYLSLLNSFILTIFSTMQNTYQHFFILRRVSG